MLSRSKAFPKGLSNNRGQVGRHYIGHWTTLPVLALFPFDINIWYGTPAQGITVDDWSDDTYDHTGLGFIGGSVMHAYHELHPIQAAFKEEHGLQCGFCTPGMMLVGKALLDRNPDPTEEEVRWAISGNICRCTGYTNIVKAIQRAGREIRGAREVAAEPTAEPAHADQPPAGAPAS